MKKILFLLLIIFSYVITNAFALNKTCINNAFKEELEECINLNKLADQNQRKAIKTNLQYNNLCIGNFVENGLVERNGSQINILYENAIIRYQKCIENYNITGEFYLNNEAVPDRTIRFKNIENFEIFRTNVENGKFEISLEKGTYYWRIANIGGGKIIVDKDKTIGKYNLIGLMIDFGSNDNTEGIELIGNINGSNFPIIKEKRTNKNKILYMIPGKYDIKVKKDGIGVIYQKDNFNFEIEGKISVDWGKLIGNIKGNVKDTDGALGNSNIIIRKKTLGPKNISHINTDKNGNFAIDLLKGEYNFAIKKKGYYDYFGEFSLLQNNIDLGNITMTKIKSNIVFSGKILSTHELTGGKLAGFITLNGVEIDGNDKIQVNLIEKFDTKGNFSFDIPKGYNWKMTITGKGHEILEIYLGEINNNFSDEYILTYNGLIKDIIKEKISSGGGRVQDKNVIVTYTQETFKNRFSGGGSVYLTIQETNSYPVQFGYNSIGNKSFDINATDDKGNEIRQFDDNIELELIYYGTDIVNTFSGITIHDIDNLSILYFDEDNLLWFPLKTYVTIEGIDLGKYSKNTKLIDIDNYEKIIIRLVGYTKHFTLFTSLISTSIDNSDSSLTEGINITYDLISNHLGNISQTIQLTSGKSFDEVVKFIRNGKEIQLKDVINTQTKGANTINLAIGDVLQTNNKGGIKLSIDGYNQIGLEPGSSIKILKADSNQLEYNNLAGKTNFNFEKSGAKYIVNSRLSYATIRGTQISIDSTQNGDIYEIIEGKIDVYNSVSNKSITLEKGDKYTILNDGKDKKEKTEENTEKNDGYVDTKVGKIDYGAYNSADLLHKNGITKISPYDAPYYDNLKRWEAALLIGRMSTKILNKEFINDSIVFSDIGEFAGSDQIEIINAYRLGLFKGYKGQFMPNDNITKGQAIMVFARLLNNNLSMEIDESYEYMLSNGYIENDDRSSQGNGPINRKELYIIIDKIISNN